MPSTELYYWPRSFVIRSTDFVQEKPYRRIATTLIAAAEGELSVRTEDRGEFRCGAVVLGPAARRLALRIEGVRGFLFEAQPLSAEHAALMGWLAHAPSRLLDGAPLEQLRAVLQAVPAGALDALQARALHRDAIAAVARPTPEVACEPRVAQVLDCLERASLDEIEIAPLAQQVGLSESRLRSLVRKQLCCSLSQYVRWLAAWKVALYWRPGVTLTDAAHAAGFHDLSHATRTTNEMFGLSPSRLLQVDQVALIPCFEPSALAIV